MKIGFEKWVLLEIKWDKTLNLPLKDCVPASRKVYSEGKEKREDHTEKALRKAQGADRNLN